MLASFPLQFIFVLLQIERRKNIWLFSQVTGAYKLFHNFSAKNHSHEKNAPKAFVLFSIKET
jgi:hypothetical protein